jgi:LysM repeat protein
MRKQIITIVISFLVLLSLSIYGQTSYPTKKVNGTEYYVYTVQPSEGVYAIARKFGTSATEIFKLNPQASQGVKINEELLIPIVPKDQMPKAEASKPSSSSKYIEHKVEKQQTLFAISKKYNVSIDEIKKLNPQLVNGLTEGAIIKIPASNPTPTSAPVPAKVNATVAPITPKPIAEPVVAKQSTYIIHKVQPKETLYSICKRYEVSINEVLQLNPNAANLTSGTDLKIPSNASTPVQVAKKEQVDTPKTKVEPPVVVVPAKVEKKIIRLGFLLPFMLNQEKKDAGTERFVDFYSGALMAINEAKQQGISIEVYVYDTEKSDEKVTEILKNPELKTMDLLIGPAFSSQIPVVGKFAKENRIYTLIPFSSKVPEIYSNTYLFQFNPGADVDLIVNQAKNMRIIFAEVPGVNETDAGKVWADELKKALTKNGKTFSVIELSASDYANYGAVLKKGEKNLIIFNTDKYSSITGFLSPLRLRASEYDIVFYEHYAWRNQDIKMPQTMFISPFISKLAPEAVEKFNTQYAGYFNHDVHKSSPRYDLLGYDLSNYFIKLFNQYGTKFSTEISNFKDASGIQSQPHFERINDTAGFVNDQLYLGEEKLQ